MDDLPQRKRFRPLPGINAKTRCVISGCDKAPTHFGAAYCGKHASRLWHHGHPTATGVKPVELRAFQAYIDQGLEWFRDSPAIVAAIGVCEELLNFTPVYGRSWETYFQSRMFAIKTKRGAPVTSRDTLITIVSLFALEATGRFPDTTSRNIALARAVISMGRGARQSKPRKGHLNQIGYYIVEELGAFSVRLLQRIKERFDAAEAAKNARRAALTDFSSPAALADLRPEG